MKPFLTYGLLLFSLGACANFNIVTQAAPTQQNPSLCSGYPQKYGHYKYSEQLHEPLIAIGNGQRLASSAARAFKQMQAAAKKDGINLIPLSGYRSVEEQEYLFYGIARQKGQTLSQRAKLSAPPGYSEHQTGYAIDLNSLTQSFANTKTYQWLKTYAYQYGFEESFSLNNSQGIAYEPWHYRFRLGNSAEKVFCFLPPFN